MRLQVIVIAGFFVVVAGAGCSSGDGATPSGSAAASAAPAASTAAAPASRKEALSAAYKDAFQRGATGSNEDKEKKFLAKAGPPDATDGGTKVWYGKDADGACYEMSLDAGFMFSSSKIFDAKKAAEKCK